MEKKKGTSAKSLSVLQAVEDKSSWWEEGQRDLILLRFRAHSRQSVCVQMLACRPWQKSDTSITTSIPRLKAKQDNEVAVHIKALS